MSTPLARPILPLASILDQPQAVRALRSLISADASIPPILLHGPEGVGKTTAALSFAATLVCRRPIAGSPCGDCGACARIAESAAVTALRENATAGDAPRQYPDAGLIGIPEGKSRILVVQARDVALSMSLQPFELPRRIYVIDPADSLTDSAANALLKILEEPPAYGVLILVATAPWSLPITVRSRLRRIPFRPLTIPTVEKLLRGLDFAPEDARLRAARATGSVARALRVDPQLDDERLATWVSLLERLARGAATPGALAVQAGERFGKDGETALAALDALTLLLRDLAARQQGVGPRAVSSATLEHLAPAAIELLGPALERPALIERLRQESVTLHRNPRLTVEGALLILAGALRAKDL